MSPRDITRRFKHAALSVKNDRYSAAGLESNASREYSVGSSPSLALEEDLVDELHAAIVHEHSVGNHLSIEVERRRLCIGDDERREQSESEHPGSTRSHIDSISIAQHIQSFTGGPPVEVLTARSHISAITIRESVPS